MDFIDTSNHMCLICNQTIIGLINYVEHFKTHATPHESHIVEQKINPEEIKHILPSSSGSNAAGTSKALRADQRQQSNQHAAESGNYSEDTSPLSEFIDNSDEYADPDLDTDAFLSPKHCPDFFQSLELKSATEEAPPRPKIKAVQRLSILEDDAHAESLLPITSILSNLDFSSDDDFLDVSGCEGGTTNDDNFWLSDEGEDRTSSHPPHGYTGGKWKPGEGPKRRLPIAGKWKPGHRPGPACRKNILRKPVKRRGTKCDAGKTFVCNVCNEKFLDRNSYSWHFSQPEHKLEAKKKQLAESGRHEEESTGVQSNQSVDDASARSRRLNNGSYCPVCDLYFDNATVFTTHCETKIHKDAMLKQGFREYKGNDGTLIRINVHNDKIFYKEKQENVWPTVESSRSEPAEECSVEKVPEVHECHICQKTFARKYEMARHLLTRMHRSRAQSHPEAASVEMLNKYNKYMIRLSPFQCGMCQYYFNRQRDFLDHMGSSSHVMTCEDMLGPIMCVACKYKTHKHNEMMEHLQYPEHLAAVEKNHGVCIVRESHTRITCKFCGIKMYSAVRMKRHCHRKHKNRLTEVVVAMDVKTVEYNYYNCPLCKKYFRAKSLLQLHFLKIHKNTSLFNCNVCNRGFLDQHRLDNHLRTRFHARRVVANKLKGTQRHKASALKKSVAQGKLAVRKRGRPRKEEKQVETVTSTPRKQIPTVAIETKEETGLQPRRSTRKRKKMEFFDEDLPETGKVKETVKEKDKNPAKKSEGAIQFSKTWLKKPKLNKVKFSSLTTTEDNKKQVEETQHNEKQVNENETELKTSDSTNKTKSRAENKRKDNVNGKEETNNPLPCKESTREQNVAIVSSPQESDKREILEETEGELSGEEDDEFSIGEDETVGEVYDEEKINEASKHIFSCTYCDFAAIDLMELRGHYNDNHPNDILTCQPCNQYFLSLKAYKIHCSGRGHQLKLREQSGETTMHKCPMCDKRFLQESCCQLHLETVHRHPSCEADLQRIHKGQDLVSQLYGDHVKQVESLSNDTSVSCPECGKFVRKDTLVEHLRLHTGERPYACRFCSKGFAGRLTLRRHISSHLNMPMFMCDLCGKEFKRNSHLIKHIRQHDFEKKGEKHTCHVCKAWFYTPEELARHMRRHGERNYKCKWPGCHWTFVLSGELKSHMFTHTGEKKYLCDMCGFGAPTKTRLRRHVKTHDKSRNFNCDYCPYKATCKTHLKRHMRIHINSRPFACPYCHYTCNTHENIRKHILKTQKHKGMKLYPCKLCNDFGCDSSKEFRAHLMTVHAEYLRENAIDSLAVFSGLYKKEEDFQKPKEGSEIIQVTKGRFFRSYQNPDAPIEPPKPKKPKKGNKVEEVKVVVVSPAQLQPETELQQQPSIEQEEQYQQQSQQQQHQEQQQQAHQQQYLIHHQQLQQQQLQQQEVGDVAQETETLEETPQYIEVPNMVLHTYDPQQAQQLTGNTVTFSPAVIQQQQPQLPTAQQLPVTVAVSEDNKVYWTVIPEQEEKAQDPAPTPEPWYSGMPQVHNPTTQELQQQYRPIEVVTSHTGNFLPSSYFCNVPMADLQNTVGGQIYTGVVENVVVLSDPTRPETAANL